MPDKEIKVEKEKFDKLLRKMLESDPLPKKDVKVEHPKPKKKPRPEERG